MEKKVVLIADGDDFIRAQILHCLKDNINMDYIEARDGKEALSSILSMLPDLILLELDLSIINGIEILKRVKRSPNENIRKIPILIFSAIKEKSAVKQVVLMGVAGYIAKPFDEDHVVEKITSILVKDETKEMIENSIKPKLIEIFGNVLADDILSKAAIVGMKGTSKSEKLKLIIESICYDQKFIGMLGTDGASKLQDEWNEWIYGLQ